MVWRLSSASHLARCESIYTAGYLGGSVATQHIKTMNLFFSENEQAARIAGSCLRTMAVVMTTRGYGEDVHARRHGPRRSNAWLLGQVYSEHIGGFIEVAVARTARICGAFFIVDNVREAAALCRAL